MQRLNRAKIITILFMSIVIAITSFLAMLFNDENLEIIKGDSVEFNEGWNLYYPQGENLNVSLPIDIKLEPNDLFTITNRLPEQMGKNSYLLLRSSMQKMSVFVDDELIFRHSQTKNGLLKKPISSLWLMVELEENYAGKTIEIEIKSSVLAFSGVINEIKMGSQIVLVADIIREQFVGIITFALLLLIGMVAMVASFFIRENQDNRLFYLGNMGICTSIWIISETRLLQFITGNRYLISAASYLVVPLIALFINLYIREVFIENEKRKRILKGFAFIIMGLLVISVLLQIFGIMEYIDSLKYSLLVIVSLFVITGFMIYSDYKKSNRKETRKFAIYLIIIAVSVTLEIFVFYLGKYDLTSSFFRIGILILFVFIIKDYFIYLKISFSEKREKVLLEKLVYKDFLTGGYNRAAFERDLNIKIKNEDTFRLVLIDLNNLKVINDKYGHTYGDQAIKKIYNCLKSSFSIIGVAYRIGGDEFAVITNDTGDSAYLNAVNSLKQKLEEESNNFVHKLVVAVGSDVYDNINWNDITKFYHHVDKRMYENKLILKS